MGKKSFSRKVLSEEKKIKVKGVFFNKKTLK